MAILGLVVAVFAALTAICEKVGVENVDAEFATIFGGLVNPVASVMVRLPTIHQLVTVTSSAAE